MGSFLIFLGGVAVGAALVVFLIFSAFADFNPFGR